MSSMNVDHDSAEWVGHGWEARNYEGVVSYGHKDKAAVLTWLKEKGYKDTGDGAHFELREDAMLDSGVEPGLRTGTYNLFSMYAKESVCFTALGLIELHDWIEEHREHLEEEAAARREEIRNEQ
jgi:hypothetical protein